jgi:hypothetical protein
MAREEIRARLRNWGRWVRGGRPRLEARNGLWSDGKQALWVPDVDDAMIVEFAVTSLAQPPRATSWRRYLEIIVKHYTERGRAKDKARDLGMHRSWYFEVLGRAEDFLGGVLPD